MSEVMNAPGNAPQKPQGDTSESQARSQAMAIREQENTRTAEMMQSITRDHMDPSLAIMLSPDLARNLYRQADQYSRSDLVPEQFRNKPGNCFIALQMAIRFRCDPFMLMQHMYVVHGKPGLEAKFVIGLINQSGKFTGPLQWKWAGSGKTRSCTAYATHKVTGERCEATLDWSTVEKEGWAGKSGSKWQSMPDQMFCYRSAAFFARRFCPEVTMGLPTADELFDIDAQDRRADSDTMQVLDVEPEMDGQRIGFGKQKDQGEPAKQAAPDETPDPETKQKAADAVEKLKRAAKQNEKAHGVGKGNEGDSEADEGDSTQGGEG
ncbi:MAG: hypothetical protein ACOC8H_00085 [bacterium]